ncbi:hypothetical protein MASR1M97_32280 [Candidatus Desulfobacillus denitrificans]
MLERDDDHRAAGAEKRLAGAGGAGFEIEGLPDLVVVQRGAAGATVYIDQAFGLDQLRRQPLRGGELQVAAVAGEHAHDTGRSAGEPYHHAEKAVEQRLEIVFGGERGSDFGQDAQGLDPVDLVLVRLALRLLQHGYALLHASSPPNPVRLPRI